MTNSFKPYFSEGAHALSSLVLTYPSSPYRVLRRQSMAGGVMAAYMFAQQDISAYMQMRNWQNLVQFLDKVQAKLDLSAKVAMMFGGSGLIH